MKYLSLMILSAILFSGYKSSENDMNSSSKTASKEKGKEETLQLTKSLETSILNWNGKSLKTGIAELSSL